MKAKMATVSWSISSTKAWIAWTIPKYDTLPPSAVRKIRPPVFLVPRPPPLYSFLEYFFTLEYICPGAGGEGPGCPWGGVPQHRLHLARRAAAQAAPVTQGDCPRPSVTLTRPSVIGCTSDVHNCTSDVNKCTSDVHKCTSGVHKCVCAIRAQPCASDAQ